MKIKYSEIQVSFIIVAIFLYGVGYTKLFELFLLVFKPDSSILLIIPIIIFVIATLLNIIFVISVLLEIWEFTGEEDK